MKMLLIALMTLSVTNSFAGDFEPTDLCKKEVTQFYKKTAATSQDQWGFISLKGLNSSDAKNLVKKALPGDEETRDQMLALIENTDTLFYVLNWDAPGNAGSDIVAVEKSSCKVVKELLYRSEE